MPDVPRIHKARQRRIFLEASRLYRQLIESLVDQIEDRLLDETFGIFYHHRPAGVASQSDSFIAQEPASLDGDETVTRATPLASLELLEGQCASAAPRCLRIVRSPSSSQTP